MTTSIHIPSCPYCGATPSHNPGACPQIEAVEYYQNGAIKSVKIRRKGRMRP